MDFKDDSLNRKCLTRCLTFLCDRMIVDEVVIRLQANKVLTPHEADSIRVKETRLNKNQILVDFIQQRGPEAFSHFMKSLTETGQKYIFDKLYNERKTIVECENLRKSAEQGNASAQYKLGCIYEKGKGVPQSDEEAVKWYTKSAEQGNPRGINNLAEMYKNGRCVPQSDIEAVKWCTKSAKKGNAHAQYNLGVMYQNGRGVPQSDEEAVKWYRKSAEQGHAIAQNNLGYVYLNGKGVPQSDEEALKWYRKSAEQGNANAQSKLTEFSKRGQGIINYFCKYLSYALGEIKILHQLDHERVIKFYGFYLDQGQMIIFMDAMRGSVKDEISEKGCLSETKALNYFIQAVEGLVYVHSRRPAIVHRDLKCENLLLTAEYNVKLADFGLAISIVIDNGSKKNLSTAPKSFVGTHLFHAPEIIQTVNKAEAYGRKSDIWSLACTLVQMISGEPPYRSLSLIELIQRSSVTSQNPLKYSGDLLLPAASNEMKKLLDAMFIVDSKLRPSAEKVLALAHGVLRTFSIDHDVGNRLTDINGQHSLHSVSNGLQNISMNNQQTLTEAASTETVHIVRKSANVNQQTAFNEGGHGSQWRSIPKAREDSNSCRTEAKQGDTEILRELCNAYYIERGVPLSDEEAVKRYRKLAEQRDANAQCDLGDMYFSGRGVPQSDEEAVKWYTKSAEQGNADAQNKLGNMYSDGRGVTRSDEEAVKWYRKAAEQGDEEGQFNLGGMYFNGRGVPQSYEEAVKWYRKSAEQGNAVAQFNLVFMYTNGKGISQSNEEAVQWFKKSAEQGNVDAQVSLGNMYENGLGLHPSDEETVKCFRKSAEQGNAKAQYKLGNMYRDGNGVRQSNEEAVKWYTKSAGQGYAKAQF